ncbi:MAG: uroporphyrinogen-III synthase, partial [Sphingomicrobium sp.]
GASATVKRARERGLDVIAIPLFEIEPVVWEAPQATDYDGLLLTSANAVRCGGGGLGRLRPLKVYAVGQATAAAARELGFDIAVVGDSGVEALLASLDPELRLLHLCGADRKDIPGARQTIAPLEVYRSRPIDGLDLSAAANAVTLIHSPRIGQRLAELAGDRASIIIAAISEAAADAAGPGWKAVAVAEQPSDDALLALAEQLCNNPHRR